MSAIADIAQAAGYRTNRGKRVPTSRGQKRGDLLEINKIEYIGELEIKELNVAGMRDLIIDVAVCHSRP